MLYKPPQGCVWLFDMVRVKQPRAKKNETKPKPISDSDESSEDWMPRSKKKTLQHSDSDESSRTGLGSNTDSVLVGKRKRNVVKPFELSKRRMARGKKKKAKTNKPKATRKKTEKKKGSVESDEDDWIKKGFEVIKEVLAEFSKDDKKYYLLHFKGYGHEYNEIYSEVKALWNDKQSKGGGVVFQEWTKRRDSSDYVVSNEEDVCAGEYATSRHGKFIPGAYVIGKKGKRIGKLGTKEAWPLQSILPVAGSQKKDKIAKRSSRTKVSKSVTPVKSKGVGVVMPSPMRLSITGKPLDFDSLGKFDTEHDVTPLGFESEERLVDAALADSLSPTHVKTKVKRKPKPLKGREKRRVM